MRKYETPEQRDRREEQEGEAFSAMIDKVTMEFVEKGLRADPAKIYAEACKRIDQIKADRNQEAAEDAHSLRMSGL